jgi:hypothetical protein
VHVKLKFSQEPLRAFPPIVSRRNLVRSGDVGVEASGVVGALVSESVGLDDVDEPRWRVSARISSKLTLYSDRGPAEVSSSSVNFDVVIVEHVARKLCGGEYCNSKRSGC